MLRVQRIDAIQHYVAKHRQVDLDTLCDVFAVSKNTIRRDIDELCKKGGIKKIYGGVSAVDQDTFLPFHERDSRSQDAKRKIAAAAAALVDDGDIVFVDSGTTTRHMARDMAEKRDVTVLTNNLEFIAAAIPHPNLKIITLSGTLNRTTLSFSGGAAAKTLSQYNVAKAFMAAVGVSLENGATNYYTSEYDIKTTAMQRSKMKVLLADHAKLDVVSLQTFAGLDEFDIVISEPPLPPAYANYFKKKDIEAILIK